MSLKKKSLLILLACFFIICLLLTSSNTIGAQNWWEKLGKPEYGGEMSFAVNNVPDSIDPYTFFGTDYCYNYEPMFFPDWTVDREVWSMQSLFVPKKYFPGHLAESWEMVDPQTAIVHLHKGIRWQNKPPVNGREFTAEDVEFHYDRALGTGHGYSEPAPMPSLMLGSWEKVRAVDKYTVEYKFKIPCAGVVFYTMSDQASLNWFEAPEYVALGGPPPPPAPKGEGAPKGGGGPAMTPGLGSGGPLQDWHNAVGTGPWILSDLVHGSSVTYTRNPDYWCNDPRYPENKTPYMDGVRLLVISDASTKLAALRTGKIDMLGGFGVGITEVGWQQAKVLEKAGLVLKQMAVGDAYGVVFRHDRKPFTDIRVRKAMDMAIDREAISKSLYGGTVPGTPTGFANQSLKGWCYAYDEWPQELKDEYAYNPEKAKQLLAEAGYPNGFKTNVYTMGSFNELLEIYKSYFRDIGIDMDINVMEGAAYSNFSRIQSKHDQMAEFQVAGGHPPTRTIDMFYSKGMDFGLHRINDPVYEDIYKRFYDSSSDEEAQQAFIDADKWSVEIHTGVFTVHDPGYIAWHPYVKGYSGEIKFWSHQIMLSRLWVDNALKKKMGR